MIFPKVEYFRNKFQWQSIGVSNTINIGKKIAFVKKNAYKTEDKEFKLLIISVR